MVLAAAAVATNGGIYWGRPLRVGRQRSPEQLLRAAPSRLETMGCLQDLPFRSSEEEVEYPESQPVSNTFFFPLQKPGGLTLRGSPFRQNTGVHAARLAISWDTRRSKMDANALDSRFLDSASAFEKRGNSFNLPLSGKRKWLEVQRWQAALITLQARELERREKALAKKAGRQGAGPRGLMLTNRSLTEAPSPVRDRPGCTSAGRYRWETWWPGLCRLPGKGCSAPAEAL